MIRADDPVYFFYLLKVTEEESHLQNVLTDDYGHSYPPESNVIVGNYLEVSKEEQNKTTYYLDKKKAVILSYSVVGICPELLETHVTFRKKQYPGYVMEKCLFDGLKELCNLRI